MQLKGEIETDWKQLESMHSKFVSTVMREHNIFLLILSSHIFIGSHTSLGQRETIRLLLFASQRYNLHKTEKAQGYLNLFFILPKTANSKEQRLQKHSGTDMLMRTPSFTPGSFRFL